MIVTGRWDNNCCVDLRRIIVAGSWANSCCVDLRRIREDGIIVVELLCRFEEDKGRWDNSCCVDLRRIIATGRWDNMSWILTKYCPESRKSYPSLYCSQKDKHYTIHIYIKHFV